MRVGYGVHHYESYLHHNQRAWGPNYLCKSQPIGSQEILFAVRRTWFRVKSYNRRNWTLVVGTNIQSKNTQKNTAIHCGQIEQKSPYWHRHNKWYFLKKKWCNIKNTATEEAIVNEDKRQDTISIPSFSVWPYLTLAGFPHNQGSIISVSSALMPSQPQLSGCFNLRFCHPP